MHELSITQSVIDVVTERTGGDRVAIVRLQIGKLSGIVPDSVRFCFELIAADTPLAGAVLEIDEPLGRAHCKGCGEDFELRDLILLCPCGSADVVVMAGTELAVKSVEVV
ncbi:MAG: hydrogenase maturation nickel metallochaperone HypA [Actinomycetota bacterium]|nr:hydrogenase maturation nickel metallochaperone HypA [Geodermatophilaceae bacterium]MDQ3055057.1 hydrogenase maturation nickel metallochaperone HypA [Actinomycetota bacterium]